MKGVFFTEFLDMVEQQYSADLVDDLIITAQLPSNGAYTAVGMYSIKELNTLITTLAQLTHSDNNSIIRIWGQHLFKRLYPNYAQQCLEYHGIKIHDTFSMLSHLDDYIQLEILKLYYVEELPTFSVAYEAPHILLLNYSSPNQMKWAIYGVIEACLAHFQEHAKISFIDTSDETRTRVVFRIEKVSA